MKRLAAFVLAVILMTMLIAGTPAYAEKNLELPRVGDQISILRDISIDKKVRGDVISIGGDVAIRDSVSGDVVSLFGDTIVDAEINGDIVVVFGNIKLTDRAVVRGDLVAIGTVERHGMSVVEGQEVNIDIEILPFTKTAVGILLLLFPCFVFLLGLPLIAIFRDRFYNISIMIFNNVIRRTALGFPVFIGFTLFLPLLAITVIGPLFYLVMIAAAEAVTGILIGSCLVRTFSFKPRVFLEYGIGFAVMTLLKAALVILLLKTEATAFIVGYVLMVLFINSFGLGTLISTKFGSFSAGQDR